jgi:heat shock protein HslJ
MPTLMTTLMGCPEGSLGSDFSFWLSTVTEFELTDEGLTLSLEDGGTLHFEAALSGVTWEWHEYQGSDDTVMAPEDPDDYTLRFESDDHALIRADCNIGSGTVKVDGSTIAIGTIALTRVACPQPSLERDYVRMLDDASSFLFVGGRLALVLPMDAGTMIFTATPIEVEQPGNAMATPEGGG